MTQPATPLTVIVENEYELEALTCCLEWGYDSIREQFAPGDGTSSPQQDACYELMRKVGVR